MKLRADVLVGGLMRATQAAGGFATVMSKGAAEVGSVIVVCAERGQITAILEPLLTGNGAYAWQRVGPETDDSQRADYLSRRRKFDPDLWVVELDIADAQRFTVDFAPLN